MRYDFIEIGTSDFDTLLQKANPTTIGLSVEPLNYYLEKLPNKPGVTKVNAALSNTDGHLEIYHIPVREIERYGLPYWVRGCNSLSKPHQFMMDSIGVELYNQIVQVDRVPTITWTTLINRYNIESVDVIKIDTEGHEYIILKDYFDMCKDNPAMYANKITFEYNENSDRSALDELISSVDVYDFELCDFDMVLTKKKPMTKAYVLYATCSYRETVAACVASINKFSDVPVIVYMLNSDVIIDGAKTINWKCDVEDVPQNDYIDRNDREIYNILIQRPLIVKDALQYAQTVAYIDSDSVVTPHIDNIFSLYPTNLDYPYFVEGIYEYLLMNGRGGVTDRNDLSMTLEAPACELFGVNQYVRTNYRQTGYFVANDKCIQFLDEWWWMCNHPEVVKNPQYYAPFHEETIVNILLWKKKILTGLPYIYVNGTLDTIDVVYNELGFTGVAREIDNWFKIPDSKSNLLAFHGEKKSDVMHKMIEELENVVKDSIKVLFLAPHLSTGGMPGFLLKRIQTLKQNSDIEIFVVEYTDYGPSYVVQKNQIKSLVNNFYTLSSNKHELVDIIKRNNIDIVHADEILEGFDSHNNIPADLLSQLYSKDRTWRIVETCHNVWFEPKNKMFNPEGYAFCTPHHLKTFANVPSYKEVLEFPIDPKETSFDTRNVARQHLGFSNDRKHVVNIGLWTPGKNQGEGLEIARKYPQMMFHFVGNQAVNFQEYWEPLMKNLPENVKIWGERNDTELFLSAADIFMFNSTWECNPLVLREAISHQLPIVARNLPQYEDMFTPYLQPIDTDLSTIICDYDVPDNNTSDDFGIAHDVFYKHVLTIPIVEQKPKSNVSITQNFVGQPFLEITGTSVNKFKVCFYDESGMLYYSNQIGPNSWVKLNRTYFTRWITRVWENDQLIYENILNLEGKRVYIAFDSSSLGDSIAWMPYVLEFKKKHNCHVIVSTFKNFLFKDVYPELEFINPGDVAPDIHAMYKIGWFYDVNKEPALPNTVNLQKCAASILGLDYQEIRPRINYQVGNNLYGKYVTIATNSTAGCKFWTKEGWQGVIDYLVQQGYGVINVSKEKNPFEGVIQIEDDSMENTMNVIHHSEFFIGLSSGLSWLAWAMGKKVVMISNFTQPDHEFSCIRVTKKDVCNGCWNNPNFKFDRGDWNWCPVHKGTDRQFECHTTITANDVIAVMEQDMP